MFLGEFVTQISDKNRIAIPKKIREKLNGKVILTRGYERCLLMVDFERWENLISEINKRPLLSLNVRDTKRFILGGATDVEYDSQGRFIIPDTLKNFANLMEEVTFVGVGEWIEIWSTQKWNEKLNVLSENVSDIADRLSA
jgi:MraZ protein